jgi:cysteine synthase A
MQKFGVSEGPIASVWKMLILKSTGERHLTTLLVEGIDAEMSEEELALSRSTPSAQFPPA